MFLYGKCLNNMAEIVIYTLVSLHPFSWWYVHLTTALLILRQVVSFWCWWRLWWIFSIWSLFAKWIMMFILLVSLPYSSIHLTFMCFLAPGGSSLVCSSLLHLHTGILYILAFMYIKYYSSVFFVTLFLNWSPGIIICSWGVIIIKIIACLHCTIFHPVPLLFKVSVIILDLYFFTQYHIVRVTNLSFSTE